MTTPYKFNFEEALSQVDEGSTGAGSPRSIEGMTIRALLGIGLELQRIGVELKRGELTNLDGIATSLNHLADHFAGES